MTIGGGGAAVFFVVAPFPALEDAAPVAALAVVSLTASNVVKDSCCSLGSGFWRRRRGRFGSSIGSSDTDLDGAAGFAGSGGAAGLVASGAVGGAGGGGAVGGCAG